MPSEVGERRLRCRHWQYRDGGGAPAGLGRARHRMICAFAAILRKFLTVAVRSLSAVAPRLATSCGRAVRPRSIDRGRDPMQPISRRRALICLTGVGVGAVSFRGQGVSARHRFLLLSADGTFDWFNGTGVWSYDVTDAFDFTITTFACPGAGRGAHSLRTWRRRPGCLPACSRRRTGSPLRLPRAVPRQRWP